MSKAGDHFLRQEKRLAVRAEKGNRGKNCWPKQMLL